MRLIDADAFLERNKEFADRDFNHPKYEDTLRELVDEEPTVDAVEVVRCKDCKEYYLPFNHMQVEQVWTCMRYGLLRNADDFCSRGERRSDDQT